MRRTDGRTDGQTFFCSYKAMETLTAISLRELLLRRIKRNQRPKNATHARTDIFCSYLKLPAVAGGVREAKDLPGSLRLPGVWTRMFHFFGTRQSNFIATRLFHFFASSLFYFLILERLGPTLLFSNLLKEKKKKHLAITFDF